MVIDHLFSSSGSFFFCSIYGPLFVEQWSSNQSYYTQFVTMEQELVQKTTLSSDDIKQALFRSAGYGGRCLWCEDLYWGGGTASKCNLGIEEEIFFVSFSEIHLYRFTREKAGLLFLSMYGNIGFLQQLKMEMSINIGD